VKEVNDIVESIDASLPKLLRWILRSNYANVKDSVAIDGIPMGIHFELENTNRGNEELWAKAMIEIKGKMRRQHLQQFMAGLYFIVPIAHKSFSVIRSPELS
jgi:hypothetical protein